MNRQQFDELKQGICVWCDMALEREGAGVNEWPCGIRVKFWELIIIFNWANNGLYNEGVNFWL